MAQLFHKLLGQCEANDYKVLVPSGRYKVHTRTGSDLNCRTASVSYSALSDQGSQGGSDLSSRSPENFANDRSKLAHALNLVYEKDVTRTLPSMLANVQLKPASLKIL